MMAFFDNYDTYKINLEFAEGSDGALEKQFSTWEQSWEAATGRMKNAWQGLYSEIIDDQAFIGVIDGLSEVINKVTELIQAMGGIGPVLTTIGGMFMAYFGGSGAISAGISKIANTFAIMTGTANK